MKKITALFTSFVLLLALFSFTVGALDVNSLPDGEYEIGIELWHAEDSKKSMAASAFEEKAFIKVSEGKYTVQIFTGPMTIMMITASLQEMRVQLSDGTYVNAEVAETDKNGTPTSFTFPVDGIKEFINVKVNPKVAVIGNMEMDARLKFDLESVKEKTQEETTTAAPVETTAAPVETTAAPVETTAAPVETTAAPVETTAAPVETTAAPVETTAAPVETTAAPVETTAAPVETTAAPVETTAAPVETTAAPVETVEETTTNADEEKNGGTFKGILAVIAALVLIIGIILIVLKRKKK